jgi:hypothetical protein
MLTKPSKRRQAAVAVPGTMTGQPGLITADPSVRRLLLQVQAKGTNSVKLASLDLATGHVTYLPSGWLASLGDVITW